MIQVDEWSRSHRSDFERWPCEPNPLVSAFLLRADDEPYWWPPRSLAVLVGGQLVGRFSYRLNDGRAFVGLVLSPSWRGRRLSCSAMRASLCWLAARGVALADASVAVANIASCKMLVGAGFVFDCLEWRYLPGDYDVSLLRGLPESSYVLAGGPRGLPGLLYGRLSARIDVHMYAEVAQR